MRPIHPINAEQCKPHFGKPVCVIMKDGSELFGTLSRLESGKLILNETAEAVSGRNRGKTANFRTKKGKSAAKGRKAEQAGIAAQTAAPGPEFGGALTLDPSLIGLLFVLT